MERHRRCVHKKEVPSLPSIVRPEFRPSNPLADSSPTKAAAAPTGAWPPYWPLLNGTIVRLPHREPSLLTKPPTAAGFVDGTKVPAPHRWCGKASALRSSSEVPPHPKQAKACIGQAAACLPTRGSHRRLMQPAAAKLLWLFKGSAPYRPQALSA